MGTDLSPYVPRLALSWLRDQPTARYRRIVGTMAFCDVSGFTAMSERLARQGKVGAEELTEILNAVFAELLERAADYGGGMLKYGGDAVLVFFTGDDHERRAAAATAAMRAGLRVVGRRQTSAGHVNLRMSVGVHTGEFDFFLVGTSHRELVVAGPAATLTCAMETAADAGQILVSSATAAALGRSHLGARKGDGVLLARAPSVARLTAHSHEPDGDAAPLVPTALRRYLLAGDDEPEHRQVTVGFLAFSHLDQHLSQHGGDAVAELLDELVGVVDQEFEAHGVTFLASDIYGDGGKIIAVTGAPAGYDNNDERMLRAMRGVVDRYDGLPLHVGLNRGAVFTGDVGPAFRRTYTMLGDAVNTAARVMAKATDGEIRTMPAVLDRSATLFDVVEQEPFLAKGKKEPLVTFTVGAVVGQRPAISERLPLVGRDGELAALRELAQRAAGGDGHVVEIVGPAGIGKTRLLEEFVSELDQPALMARCERYEASTPFFAVRQVVSAALGGAASAAQLSERCDDPVLARLRRWLPLLAGVMRIDMPSTAEVDQLAPGAYTRRVHAVVNDVLDATHRERAVFVVDDAQWLDAASKAYLASLERLTTSRPWLVVLSRRPEDEPAIESDPPAKLLTIGPLSDEASAALARVAAPRVLLPSQAKRLAQRGGGHPLFVQELARAAMTARDAESLPDTVDAMVASRIDELIPRERNKLRSAAVLGAAFDVALLRELIGDANLSDLSEFIDVHDGRARFRQALFQQAAYDGLPFRRRKDLHLGVARLLEHADPDGNVEQLSLHYAAAANHDAAWRYSMLAAELAKARFSYSDAAVFYERAITAARHGGTRPGTEVAIAWKDMGGCLFNVGRLVEAQFAYAKARRLSGGDVSLQTRLCLNEGEVRISLGDPGGARRWTNRGLRLTEQHAEVESFLRCRLLLTVASIEMHRGNPIAAEWAQRAIELADRGEGPTEQARAYAFAAAVAVYLRVGDPVPPGERALRLFIEIGDRSGEGSVLNNLGMVAQMRGDWRAAVDSYARAVEAHTAAGFDLFAASTATNLGEILTDQGRLDEARPALEDAAAVLETGRSYELFFVLSYLVGLLALQGEFRAAYDLLDRIDVMPTAGSPNEVGALVTRRALLLLLDHRPEATEQVLDAAEAAAPGLQSARLVWERGVAHAQQGRNTEAVATFRSAVAMAAATGEDYDAAVAQHALSRLLDGQDAKVAAAEAAATFERLGVVAPPPLLLS